MLLSLTALGAAPLERSTDGELESIASVDGDESSPSKAQPEAGSHKADSGPAVASYDPVLNTNVVDEAEATAAANGSVRVIVSLGIPWIPEDDLPGREARERQREEIRAAQDEVLSAIEAQIQKEDLTRLIWQYTTTPEIALELSPVALDALLASDLAAQIQIDRPESASLVQSVPFVIEDLDGVRNGGLDGSGVAVVILDTGVDKTHPFVSGKVVAEACFSSSGDCPNGETSQTGVGAGVQCTYASACSHGTHVAGIAAGALSAGECAVAGGEPCEGLAPGADVVAIQVFSMFTGPNCGGGEDPCALSFASDQKAGLDYIAADLGALPIAAVNVSIGGGQFSNTCDTDTRVTSVQTLKASGIATVIASGNDGYTTATGSPACISDAVTLGSTTETGVVPIATCVVTGTPFYSNSDEHVDLFAPGGWVCNSNGTDGRPGSLVRSSVLGGAYSGFQGTSMAAPHVTGAFALLHQIDPSIGVDTAVAFLRDSADLTVDARPKSDSGVNGLNRWVARLLIPSCLADTSSCLGEPSNNDFAQALDLSLNPCAGVNDCFSYLADKEAGEPNHAGFTGGNSVWFKWVAPSDGKIDVSTSGSNFDTLLAVYTGSSVSGLTEVASNDDAPAGGSTSALEGAVVSGGTTYRIAVDGFPAASYFDARSTDLAWAGSIQISLGFTPDNLPSPPPPDAADEVLFYRSGDGVFKYYDVKASAALGYSYSSGLYSKGWDSITAIDLDGDGNDEQFFYRSSDGVFKYYDVKPNGSLGALLQSGVYSKGWDSITAVDLDGDGKDEFFFYRSSDGVFKYYKTKSNGSLGALLQSGVYSLGWDSITKVDVEGDGKDEFFFYRSTDGVFKYYRMNPSGGVGSLLSSGLYSTGWDSITALDVDGDGKDEFFFYRSTDGVFKYYKMKTNASVGALLQSGVYSTGWSSITGINFDG